MRQSDDQVRIAPLGSDDGLGSLDRVGKGGAGQGARRHWRFRIGQPDDQDDQAAAAEFQATGQEPRGVTAARRPRPREPPVGQHQLNTSPEFPIEPYVARGRPCHTNSLQSDLAARF